MRFFGVVLLITFLFNSVNAQENKDRIEKINSLLPKLSTNSSNQSFESRSQVYESEPGILKLVTTNRRNGKIYDEAEFLLQAHELDKSRLATKEIECCNILEFYCKDRSFDCVEYLDRTSKQARPIPYLLLNKTWKDNQHVIFNVERLLEEINKGKSKSIHSKKTGVVKLIKNGGVYLVNLKIGGEAMTAILDSGASVVSISKKLEKELLSKKIITKHDYISPAKYRIANGKILTAQRCVLPSVSVGGLKMKNIVCSIVDDATTILLGKSFLDQFARWSIDNNKQTLTLEK